ncbi:MAG: hypothetical protein ACTSWN_05585 [Promethearchaeota archaeon]
MPNIGKEELLRILPQLIREDDTIKGAIITALSGVVATREDIRDLIETLDRRFEAAAKEREAMRKQADKRFAAMQEQMDKRFEVAAQERKAILEEMHKRFEEAAKEREAIREQIDKRFEEAAKEREAIREQMNKKLDILDLSIRRMETKEGRLLESTILKLMAETLKMENIDPNKITKKQITDRDGKVFLKGYSTDVDVIVQDGNTYILEIKASADNNYVEHFYQIGRLYELVENRKVTMKILVALRATERAFVSASKLGIHIIHGNNL